MWAATGRVLFAVGAGAVVLLAPPDRHGWSRLAANAIDDALPPRLDDVATLVSATALWLLALWVLVALLAGWAASLPGACGAVGRLVVRVCVPRALRAVVLGGVAGGLLLGPAVAANASPVWPTSPAVATTTATTTTATTPGPAWPTSPPAAAPTSPAPAWPTGPTPPPVTPPTTPTTPPTSTTPAPPSTPTTPTRAGAAAVVVARGDSLWSITAGQLRQAGVTPTDAEIAATWPAWYAANRTAIGPDPGLLRPGTHLTAPTTTDGSTP